MLDNSEEAPSPLDFVLDGDLKDKLNLVLETLSYFILFYLFFYLDNSPNIKYR